jgi:YD repeat-containing protein
VHTASVALGDGSIVSTADAVWTDAAPCVPSAMTSTTSAGTTFDYTYDAEGRLLTEDWYGFHADWFWTCPR